MEVRNEDNLTTDGLRSQASRAWSQPRLSVLGAVCGLTETGSRNGMEDGYQNDFCNPLPIGGGPANMIYNMC